MSASSTSSFSTAGTPATTSSPTLSTSAKPALPRRSERRRSLFGETRPHFATTPPLPAVAAAAAAPTMSNSSSTRSIASSQTEACAMREKRASMSAVAPLKLTNKRASTTASSSSASSSPALSPGSSAATTPTMPVKSQRRKSIHTPTSSISRSRTLDSASEFIKGIGLEFAPPYRGSDHTSSSSSMHPNPSALSIASSSTSTHHSSSNLSPPSSLSSPLLVHPNADRGGKSHDAVFSRAQDDPWVRDETRTRRASLRAVPMGLSRSHQEMIDASPIVFARNEAQGLWESVRGLMDEFGAMDMDDGMHDGMTNSNADGDKGERGEQQGENRGDVARSLLQEQVGAVATMQDASTPSINISALPASPSGEGPVDANMTPVTRSQSQSQSHPQALAPPASCSTPSATAINRSADSEAGASPRTKSLWALFRAPSPSLRSASASSSYSSTHNASTASLVSSTNLSLFGRKILARTPSTPTTSTTLAPSAPSDCADLSAPNRLSRTAVDESHLADLIVSCADARHTLKTDSDPAKLRDVGLKLERAWREQLAEAQRLRLKLEVAEDTVEDLEDENRGLRTQLGCLSEEVVSRETEVRAERERAAMEVERVKREAEVVRERERAGWQVERTGWTRRWMEERAVVAGLGLLLRHDRTRSETSLLVNPADECDNNLPASIRHHALDQARPLATQDDFAPDFTYQHLFRCPTHRFAQATAAPPSTLVDERVLLIGTDQRLLAALVQKLASIGLTRILVAIPLSNSPPASPALHRRAAVQTVSFDLHHNDAWSTLLDLARVKLGGQPDCIVDAFDQLDVDHLAQASRLIAAQCELAAHSLSSPLSVVNLVYEAGEPTCTMAMLGLGRTLSTRRRPAGAAASAASAAVRFNSILVDVECDTAAEVVLQLIDPCCSTTGAVLQLEHGGVSCVGAPLCCAAAGGADSRGLLGGIRAQNHQRGASWVKQGKQQADVQLWSAMMEENAALRARLELLHRE